MTKITLSVILVTLAGCASTGFDWRGLHIDGSSKSAFDQSVVAFQQGLPPNARVRFYVALLEIWSTAAAQADPESSVDETAAACRAQLDGLGYGEIISLAGPVAKQKYVALVASPANLPAGYPVDMAPALSRGFTAEMNPNPFGPYPGQPLYPPQ